MKKNQLQKNEIFKKDDVEKMNHLICDRLNGIILSPESKIPVDNQLCDSREDEKYYGFMEKWNVDYDLYQEYISTLSMDDVKSIFRNYWNEELNVR